MGIMPVADDFKEFLRLLNWERVRYLLVGGYADELPFFDDGRPWNRPRSGRVERREGSPRDRWSKHIADEHARANDVRGEGSSTGDDVQPYRGRRRARGGAPAPR